MNNNRSSPLFFLKLWAKSKISRAFARYVGPSCSALMLDVDGMKLLVPPTDLSLARAVSRAGVYNKPLLAKLKSIVDGNTRVLFVGTHVGSLLVPIAKRAASATAIEANPDTYKLLKLNLDLNRITNVDLHNVAAYDQEGTVDFLASHENTGGSKIANGMNKSYEFVYDQPTPVKVLSKRLDDLLPDAVFDVIVIDVEGADYKAMKGMPRLLGSAKKIILEVLPNALEKVAHVSPEEFFGILPPSITRATPIDSPEIKPPFPRHEFLAMYQDIVRHHQMDGVDVLFE